MVVNINKKSYSRRTDPTATVCVVQLIDLNIPLLTNARLASAFITAFCTLPLEALQIKSWAEYH